MTTGWLFKIAIDGGNVNNNQVAVLGPIEMNFIACGFDLYKLITVGQSAYDNQVMCSSRSIDRPFQFRRRMNNGPQWIEY